MKKGLMITSAVAAIVAFTACSKKDDKGGKPSANIPNELEEMQIVQVTHLNANEKKEISNFFKGAKTLPSLSLLPTGKESSSARAKKEDSIRKLQGREREIFLKMRENCKVTDERSTANQEFKAGMVLPVDNNISVSGRNCPVVGEENQKGQMEVLYSNREEIMEEFKQSRSLETLDKMDMAYNYSVRTQQYNQVSRELERELGVRGMVADIAASGAVQIEGRTSKTFANMSGVISYENVDKDLDITVKGQSLTVNEKGDLNMKMNFKLNSTFVVFQIVKRSTRAQYYINGRQVTEADVKELFGDLGNIANSTN